ncbi:MAG: hypothetical protein H6627_00420 [Calditrichae bacterium]|nr:hypothetical protein [Calditrichota bacterium]MCB9057000.1 hypothetical protein [Calditrichia bacterium]
MSVINKLASSLDRRDEIPNQQLALEIILSNDKDAVKELMDNLDNKKSIQNDCIKVLYEIGEQKPGLIAEYYQNFIDLLSTKNNRLQWGAMTALNTITLEKPQEIFAALSTILEAADRGTVITKDNAFNILVKLCVFEAYKNDAFSLLIKQLERSLPNQFPMYAERSLPVVDNKNKAVFKDVLLLRLVDLEKESQRKRIEKIIRKLNM